MIFGTLQRYVTRELLKIFVLTAFGLTLTFSLCGGVMNMIQAEVLTAVQLARILGFVLPISLSLTLPISALFACAIVYGRLASDNEFDACKASGINIHRLLMPAFILSVFISGFTYTFINHILPRTIEQLDAMVRKDIQKIVYQALTTQGHLSFQGYVLYAGDTRLYDDKPGAKTIYIQNAAFLEMNGDNLSRCGTSKKAVVDFSTAPETGGPMVQAALYDIRGLDVERNEVFETGRQPFDPMQLPNKIKLNPKWLTLPDLWYYRDHLLELPSIAGNVGKLKDMTREAQFYRFAFTRLTGADHVLRIKDDRVSYEIRGAEVQQDRDSLYPTIFEAVVRQKDAEGRTRQYKAETCRILAARKSFPQSAMLVSLTLKGNVTMTDMADPKAEVPARKRWELDQVLLTDDAPGVEPPLDTATLLGDLSGPEAIEEELPSLGLGARISDERVSYRKDVIKMGQEITGIIHSRLAFSASTLVILVLAAALGIIFRGGQLLTAFVISFVPGMVVVVLNIMGRQLTENTGTHLAGIGLIWGGIGLLMVADFVVLTRLLKR